MELKRSISRLINGVRRGRCQVIKAHTDSDLKLGTVFCQTVPEVKSHSFQHLQCFQVFLCNGHYKNLDALWILISGSK